MEDIFQRLISSIAQDNSDQASNILESYSSNINSQQLAKALIRASSRGNFVVAKILLECGANPNGFLDQVPLINAVLCNNLKLVQLLIESNADLDRQDENTYTALMYSISSNHGEIFDALISAGASPEVETYDGDTALRIAEKMGDVRKLELMHKSLERGNYL